MPSIIFFDGVCNLCNRSVNFIIRHDKKNKFQFSPLQGETARQLLTSLTSFANMQSIVLLEDNEIFVKSTAALRIARSLSGGWKLLYVLVIVPRFLRDKVYDYIAANRFRWYGKRDTCMIPSPELRAKFLP